MNTERIIAAMKQRPSVLWVSMFVPYNPGLVKSLAKDLGLHPRHDVDWDMVCDALNEWDSPSEEDE